MSKTFRQSRLKQIQELKKIRKEFGLKETKSYEEYLKAEKTRKKRSNKKTLI